MADNFGGVWGTVWGAIRFGEPRTLLPFFELIAAVKTFRIGRNKNIRNWVKLGLG